MQLKNNVVAITGGSKGLGKALAREFVDAEAKVVIMSRKSVELQKAAQEIGAVAKPLDVTKKDHVAKIVEEIVSEFGRIDMWVNNAGVWSPLINIEGTDIEKAHEIMEVNLFGTIYGVQAVLPYMKKENRGTILNILSSRALTGKAGSSIYCASKFAEVGFIRCLEAELKPTAIKVLNVYPGGMKTNLFDEGPPPAFAEYMSAESVAEKIRANLELIDPEVELIIKRPGA